MANLNQSVGFKAGSHKGDVNEIARERAEHRVGPLTSEQARNNYDEINWKSKRRTR